jgi:hypothetical protein
MEIIVNNNNSNKRKADNIMDQSYELEEEELEKTQIVDQSMESHTQNVSPIKKKSKQNDFLDENDHDIHNETETTMEKTDIVDASASINESFSFDEYEIPTVDTINNEYTKNNNIFTYEEIVEHNCNYWD